MPKIKVKQIYRGYFKWLTTKPKYEVIEAISKQLEIYGYDIEINFIRLTPDGMSTLLPGYQYDGATFPAIDTETNKRSSAFHDMGYKLMKLGLLPYSFKKYFDIEFWKDCIEDGMIKLRAFGHWLGVRTIFARWAIKGWFK